MSPKLVKGYALGIAAAVSYGLNPLFALPLYGQDMTSTWVLFYRYLFAIPILAVMMLVRRKTFRVTLKQGAALAGLGLLMGFSSLALFESYRFMEASIASTMLFVYPLMVALIMAAVYRERLGWPTWACIGVSLAGLALLMRGGGESAVSAAGTVWVMVSALAYAAYLVWVGRPLLKDVPTLTLTFYVLVFGFVIFAFAGPVEGVLQVPRGIAGWGCAAGLAVFPTAVSLLCTTGAIASIGSTPTAILGVFEPVAGVMVGMGVFDETLAGIQILGLVLILGAVTFVVAGESVTRRIVTVRKMWPVRKPRR